MKQREDIQIGILPLLSLGAPNRTFPQTPFPFLAQLIAEIPETGKLILLDGSQCILISLCYRMASFSVRELYSSDTSQYSIKSPIEHPKYWHIWHSVSTSIRCTSPLQYLFSWVLCSLKSKHIVFLEIPFSFRISSM